MKPTARAAKLPIVAASATPTISVGGAAINLPELRCSNCPFATREDGTVVCPKYGEMADGSCGYSAALQTRIIEPADLQRELQGLIGAAIERAKIAILFERLSGGVPLGSTTEILESTVSMLKPLAGTRKPAEREDSVLASLVGDLIREKKAKVIQQ